MRQFPIITHSDTLDDRVSVTAQAYRPILDWVITSRYIYQFTDENLKRDYHELINRVAVEMLPHRWETTLFKEEALMFESFRPDQSVLTMRSLIQGIIALINRVRFCAVPA